MMQLPFFLTLYGVGLVCGLLAARDVPVLFLAITAWLWGALLWVLGVMIVLVLGLPVAEALGGLWLLLIALVAGGAALLWRDRNTRFSRAEWLALGGHTVLFGIAALLAALINLSRASPDSLSMLTFARILPDTTFYNLNAEQLLAVDRWGIFLAGLHTAADLLGEQYLYGAQPVFAFALLELTATSAYRLTAPQVSSRLIALALTAATTLTMFSAAMVIFQAYYIHTNLPSAAYLLAAVIALWHALDTAEPNDSARTGQAQSLRGETGGWLVLSAAAWLGFCLLRVEAVLFMLLFLALALRPARLPYRARLRALLPLIGLLIAWYAFLLIVLRNDASRLSIANNLLLIAALGGFAVLLILSRHPWIAGVLFPRVEWIVAGGLAAALIGAFALKPAHMADSVEAVWFNLTLASWPTWWGSLWLFVIAAFAFALVQPRLRYDGVFWVGIPAFFALMIVLSAVRKPYHVTWVDSANRMAIHILPLALIYAQAQIARALWGKGTE